MPPINASRDSIDDLNTEFGICLSDFLSPPNLLIKWFVISDRYSNLISLDSPFSYRYHSLVVPFVSNLVEIIGIIDSSISSSSCNAIVTLICLS